MIYPPIVLFIGKTTVGSMPITAQRLAITIHKFIGVGTSSHGIGGMFISWNVFLPIF
jgi:hypothetical protein